MKDRCIVKSCGWAHHLICSDKDARKYNLIWDLKECSGLWYFKLEWILIFQIALIFEGGLYLFSFENSSLKNLLTLKRILFWQGLSGWATPVFSLASLRTATTVCCTLCRRDSAVRGRMGGQTPKEAMWVLSS